MLDNLKLITYEQKIIQRLETLHGFVSYQNRNNNYSGFCMYGNLLKLDFRKVFEAGEFAGFHHVAISLSPHYHFNNYLHNGNDLTPGNCVKTIIDILTYLKIKPHEYDLLKVVNIEFGLNIIPETDIKNLINGIFFYKKTPFKTGAFPYFKITDATKFKNIKAYAKGLQFESFPQYGIDLNTFRFEVKSKQAKNIRTYGINTVSDLLKIETYQKLKQEVLNEWEQILLTNQTPDLSTLKPDEVQFIQNANKKDFWDEIYRVKFARSKEKYCNILTGKNNLHNQIKVQIIDKLFSFQNVTFSTQKTPIKSGKGQNGKNILKEINVENVTFHQNNIDEQRRRSDSDKRNNKYCIITGIDITRQRKGSLFVREHTLKELKTSSPTVYKELEKKYLLPENRSLPEDRQIYLICKCIRNKDSDPRNNRIRFEKKYYPKQQLQLKFKQ